MRLPVFEASRPLPWRPAPSRPAPTRRGCDQNVAVQITKLSGADGFILVDFEDAPHAGGIVRLAKKVLVDGAVNLARHLTYGYAVMQVEASGASAGINTEPDGRAVALGAFVEEARRSSVCFDPGKGVSVDDLAPVWEHDSRSPLHLGLAEHLRGTSMCSALGAVRGTSGLRVCTEVDLPPAVVARFVAAGLEVDHAGAEGIGAPCDVLIVGSKPALLDHDSIAGVQASVIVPAAPLAVTARGLAVAARRGIVVLPDFVTLAGPLLAHWPDQAATTDSLDREVAARVDMVIRAAADHPEGAWLGAAEEAERFMSTWRDELPFGRPIP